MSHIVQVIDPASGIGMGFLVNDSLSETIDGLEVKAREGAGLSGAELRALLADLEGQAGLLVKTGPEVDDEGEVVGEATDGSMLVAPTGGIDDLQAEIDALRIQVASMEERQVEADRLNAALVEDKATLEALLEKDGDDDDSDGNPTKQEKPRLPPRPRLPQRRHRISE